MEKVKIFFAAIFSALALVFGVCAGWGWLAGVANMIVGVIGMSAASVTFWGVVWLLASSVLIAIAATVVLILLAALSTGIVAALINS